MASEPEKLIDLVAEHDGPCILDDAELAHLQRRPLTHNGLRSFVTQDFPREAARCGVLRGARVCVALPSGPESATALFAFSWWGCYAPLSVAHTAAELAAELADLQPSAFVALAGSTDLVSAARLGVRAIALWPDKETSGIFELRVCSGDDHQATCCEQLATESDGGDVAMLLQTSGTTKRPKTVALTHRGLGWGAKKVSETLQLTRGDVCVNPMPLYHLHGISVNLLASVVAGAAVVCPLGTVNGQRLLRCLREHRATWYSATPTHHLALLQAAQAEQPDVELSRLTVPGLARLRFIRNCSAALAAPLARKLRAAFGTAVIPTYAMTECLPIASHPLPRDDVVASVGADTEQLCPGRGAQADDDERLGSVGTPAGAEVIIMSVLEESGDGEGEDNGYGTVDTAAVAAGEIGEVAGTAATSSHSRSIRAPVEILLTFRAPVASLQTNIDRLCCVLAFQCEGRASRPAMSASYLAFATMATVLPAGLSQA
jgi:acyl-CoA synthetase (AMP-forming)/AMP-acid ligase II